MATPVYRDEMRLPGGDGATAQPLALPASGGAEKIGAAAAQFGQAAGAAYNNYQARMQQTLATRARTDFSIALADLENEFAQDDDPVSAPDRFRTRVAELQDQHLGSIDNPLLREQARLHITTHALPSIRRVDAIGMAAASAENRGSITVRRGAAAATAKETPPGSPQRVNAVADFNWDVDQQVTDGWLTQLEGEAQKRALAGEIATGDATTFAQRWPDAFIVGAEADRLRRMLATGGVLDDGDSGAAGGTPEGAVDSSLPSASRTAHSPSQTGVNALVPTRTEALPPTREEFEQKFGRPPATDGEVEYYARAERIAGKHDNFPHLPPEERERLIEEAYLLEAQAFDRARAFALDDGFRRYAQGGIDAQWLEDNTENLYSADLDRFMRVPERVAATTSPDLLHRLLDRAIDGDGEVRNDAAALFAQGQLDRGSFLRVLDNAAGFAAELETRPWLLNLRRDLYAAAKPSGPADRVFDEADQAFTAWLKENPGAGEAATRGAMATALAEARAAKARIDRATLPLPDFVTATRDAIGPAELAGWATRLKEAHETFAISDDAFVRQVQWLRQWRAAIEHLQKGR